MKKAFVNGGYNYIISCYPDYDQITKDKIKYGLESIYILITKLVFVFFLAFLLQIELEVLIFLALYNIIRMPSFGLHATKSWICLITSTLIFIGFPITCKYVYLTKYFKVALGLILILFIYKNSPADTHKRPIINKNRRLFFKYISTFIGIIFIYISILINDNFISNCLIFSLFVQSFMIAPSVYKLFNLPYNNYLTYLANNDIWIYNVYLDINE